MSRSSANQRASGANSCVPGGISNTASGAQSMAMGEGCTASGLNSVAMGYASTASNQWAFAFGRQAFATGDRSAAFGKSTASGDYSFSTGNAQAVATNSQAFGYGRSYLSGQSSTSNGGFGALASAQSSNLNVFRLITGTAEQELTLDGTTPASSTRLILTISNPAPTNGRLWNAIIQLSAKCATAGGTVTVV